MSLKRESFCSEEAEDSQACGSLQSIYRLCSERKTTLSFQAMQRLKAASFPERNKDFVLPEEEEVSWEGRQNCYVMLELRLKFNT